MLGGCLVSLLLCPYFLNYTCFIRLLCFGNDLGLAFLQCKDCELGETGPVCNFRLTVLCVKILLMLPAT